MEASCHADIVSGDKNVLLDAATRIYWEATVLLHLLSRKAFHFLNDALSLLDDQIALTPSALFH